MFTLDRIEKLIATEYCKRTDDDEEERFWEDCATRNVYGCRCIVRAATARDDPVTARREAREEARREKIEDAERRKRDREDARFIAAARKRGSIVLSIPITFTARVESKQPKT